MVGETGIWSKELAEGTHVWSEKLAKAITTVLIDKKKFITDVGCGKGYYVKYLNDNGYNCIGLEGTACMDFVSDRVHQFDLTQKLRNRPAGNVICLEVGEHIPQEFEQVFIDNLCSICNDKLILSWALPYQIGIGHINCQDNLYIINQLRGRGFDINLTLSMYLRDNIDDHTLWFRNTLMVFDRIN